MTELNYFLKKKIKLNLIIEFIYYKKKRIISAILKYCNPIKC